MAATAHSPAENRKQEESTECARTPNMCPEPDLLELLPALPSLGLSDRFPLPSRHQSQWRGVDWSYGDESHGNQHKSGRFNWRRTSSEPIRTPSISPPPQSDSSEIQQVAISRCASSLSGLNASAAAFTSQLVPQRSATPPRPELSPSPAPRETKRHPHPYHRGQSRGRGRPNVRRPKERQWQNADKSTQRSPRSHNPREVWVGRLKSFSVANNQGFIMSSDLKAIYNRDVYLHGAQWDKANRPHVGTLLRFTVTLNEKGHPQARNVSICLWTAEDQLQIQNHVNEFSIALDAGELDRAVQLCTPECEFEVATEQGQIIPRTLEELHSSHLGQQSMHVESSYVIKLMSRGTAHNTSYWQNYHKGKLVAYGTRSDILALYQNEWKFVKRVFRVVWSEPTYAIASTTPTPIGRTIKSRPASTSSKRTALDWQSVNFLNGSHGPIGIAG